MKLIVYNFNKTILSCKPKSILDVGSGSGRYFEWSKVHGIDYTGVEIDKELAEKANAEHHTSVFRTFNGHDLSMFPNKSYDVILLVEVMEHVKDQVTLKKLLKECIRVAREYILFTTPNSSDEKFLIEHRLIYHHFTHSVGPEFKIHIGQGREDNVHLHHLKFTKDSLSKILKSLGRPFMIKETVPLDIRSTRHSNKVLFFKLWGYIDCRPRKSRIAKLKNFIKTKSKK